MTGARLGMLVAAVLASLPAPARAAAAPAFLVLDLDGCAAAPAAEIRNIVEVELRRSVAVLAGAGAETPGTARPNVAKARLTCVDLLATIEIADPVTGKTLRRTVDLEPVPPVARAHLIALSIVELLVASWSELLTDAPPAA